MGVDGSVIALIATIFGGAGLKFIESLLNKRKVTVDDATQLRRELNEQVQQLRIELKAVEEDLDKWKDKYYLLLEQHNEIKYRDIIGTINGSNGTPKI